MQNTNKTSNLTELIALGTNVQKDLTELKKNRAQGTNVTKKSKTT